MSNEIQRVVTMLQQVTEMAEALREMPELHALARGILAPVFQMNGARASVPIKRRAYTTTAARRKQMSIMAKKRWARAKRAGKNTIGAAD